MDSDILSVLDTEKEEQSYSPAMRGKKSGGNRSLVSEIKRAVGAYGSARKFDKSQPHSNSWYTANTGFKGLASYRDTAPDSQRVLIKSSLIRTGGKTPHKVTKHLTYLQREGVALDEDRGVLYSDEGKVINAEAFIASCTGDRHHFRFIVSPEFTDDMDLTIFTRDLINQMQKDLGTKLEWVAVNHYNTDNPHIHIMVRGKNDKGKDLLIPPKYLSHGIRNRACELATIEIGPRHEQDIQRALVKDIAAHRFTQIDRALLREAPYGHIDLKYVPNVAEEKISQRIKTGRLKTLETLGLAQEIYPQKWVLAGNMEEALRDLAIRGDIIKTLHKSMKSKPAELNIVVPEKLDTPIIGRVVEKGLHDEMNDKEYLIIEGVDGKHHYIKLDRYSEDVPAIKGSLVKVHLGDEVGKTADKNIDRFARENNGIYTAALHKKWVLEKVNIPKEKVDSYVKNHDLRLQRLEKMGLVSKLSEGQYQVGKNLLEQVKQCAIEDATSKGQLIQVDQLCAVDVRKAITLEGVTFLDRELVQPTVLLTRDNGLAGDLQAALVQREAHLRQRGVLQEQKASKAMLVTLEREELKTYGAKRPGRHIELAAGDTFAGKARIIALNSGQYVQVTNGDKDYVLVRYNRYHKVLHERQVTLVSRDRERSMVITSAAITRERGKEKEKEIDR